MNDGSSSSGKQPQPFEDVQRKRWSVMVNVVLDFSRGTLWWVRESLWQALLPKRYDPNSTRDAHPALSIQRHPVEDLYSRVPMLHGSSHGRGVHVRGLTEDEPDRTTSFGPLLAPVPVVELFEGATPRRLWPNTQKPRLTTDEQHALNRFLKQRNLDA